MQLYDTVNERKHPMKTVGIIAEYNPFHSGHAYQIAKAKELTGADYCIVVMSGDYVQRGTPAIMDKYLRAETALYHGADLVLELPLYYALGSAEYFATGAIALLDKLGVVDTVCFGSECGDIDLLTQFARNLLTETPLFRATLKKHLKRGGSYPSARSAALMAVAPELSAHLKVLESPNNILGIEYCKALLRRGSSIRPLTIRRLGAGYHDSGVSDTFCSALALRQALQSPAGLSALRPHIPAKAYELLCQEYGHTFPIYPEDFSLPLHYQLLSECEQGFTSHPDLNRDLSDRISRLLPQYQSFPAFCDLLKTKDRTYTRISRSLMHILLHMTAKELALFCSDDYIYYARMLGFCQESSPLLSAIKKKGSIPLLSKLADAPSYLDAHALLMLSRDIYASRVYQSIVHHKFATSPENEYQKKILRV